MGAEGARPGRLKLSGTRDYRRTALWNRWLQRGRKQGNIIGWRCSYGGWELLASPFYGNFKPNQQPYRTLVLRKNNGGNGGLPDAQSLSLIEDSVRFYENSHWIMPPGRLADNIEKDFRYMDMILLEETFRQYGILTSPVKSYSEVVDK